MLHYKEVMLGYKAVKDKNQRISNEKEVEK
jgi:hypothetical protein